MERIMGFLPALADIMVLLIRKNTWSSMELLRKHCQGMSLRMRIFFKKQQSRAAERSFPIGVCHHQGSGIPGGIWKMKIRILWLCRRMEYMLIFMRRKNGKNTYIV